MAVKTRGAGYQVDLLIDGKRHRPQFSTEAAAITWESEAKLAAKLGKPLPPLETVGGGGSIRTIGQLHKVVCEDEWHGKKSAVKLIRNGEVFVEWLGMNFRVTDITAQTLADYIRHLRKTGNSNGTINRKVSAVKVMLKLAQRRRVIDHLPYAKHQTESTGTVNYLDFSEEDPILAHLAHRGHNDFYDLVIFLIDTGARIGEALKLEYRSVKPGHVYLEATKNGKFRTIPLTSRALLAIERRRQAGKDPARPFGDVSYGRLRTTLRGIFDLLGERYSGIQQPLHVFRHSCASRLAIKGVDASRILMWMDHASLATTQRYIKLAPKDLDQVLSALEEPPAKLRVVQ